MSTQKQETPDQPLRFLIADANKEIRSLIKQMLKSCDYKNFTLADDGRLCLNKLLCEEVDVVISGWQLPTIRGIELLKRVKTNPDLFLTPFILISHENSLNKVIYALEEGADGYLVIPFTAADFAKLLNKAIEEKNNPDLYQLKMAQLIRHKFNRRYPAAIKIGYNLLQQRTNIRVSHLTGECLFEIKAFDEAGDMIRKALDDQKSSKLLNLLGKTSLASGKTNEAVTYFMAAANENPENPDGNLALAELYFKQAAVLKAHAMIDLIKNRNPSPLDLIQIGRLYLQYAPEKAWDIFNQVEPIGETLDDFITYANFLGKENSNKESILILKKCVESVPDSVTAHYNLGVMYLKSGSPKRAKTAFLKTLDLKPGYGLAEKYLAMINAQSN